MVLPHAFSGRILTEGPPLSQFTTSYRFCIQSHEYDCVTQQWSQRSLYWCDIDMQCPTVCKMAIRITNIRSIVRWSWRELSWTDLPPRWSSSRKLSAWPTFQWNWTTEMRDYFTGRSSRLDHGVDARIYSHSLSQRYTRIGLRVLSISQKIYFPIQLTW